MVNVLLTCSRSLVNLCIRLSASRNLMCPFFWSSCRALMPISWFAFRYSFSASVSASIFCKETLSWQSWSWRYCSKDSCYKTRSYRDSLKSHPGSSRRSQAHKFVRTHILWHRAQGVEARTHTLAHMTSFFTLLLYVEEQTPVESYTFPRSWCQLNIL